MVLVASGEIQYFKKKLLMLYSQIIVAFPLPGSTSKMLLITNSRISGNQTAAILWGTCGTACISAVRSVGPSSRPMSRHLRQRVFLDIQRITSRIPISTTIADRDNGAFLVLLGLVDLAFVPRPLALLWSRHQNICMKPYTTLSVKAKTIKLTMDLRMLSTTIATTSCLQPRLGILDLDLHRQIPCVQDKPYRRKSHSPLLT